MNSAKPPLAGGTPGSPGVFPAFLIRTKNRCSSLNCKEVPFGRKLSPREQSGEQRTIKQPFLAGPPPPPRPIHHARKINTQAGGPGRKTRPPRTSFKPKLFAAKALRGRPKLHYAALWRMAEVADHVPRTHSSPRNAHVVSLARGKSPSSKQQRRPLVGLKFGSSRMNCCIRQGPLQ